MAEQPGQVMVDVKNVVKRFPVGDTEIAVLKGVSFQVQRGECLAIVGPSGNGKSTLLKLVKEAGIGSSVLGIPEGSDFYTPLIVAGRWLLPGDGHAVVLTRETAGKNHIQVGDRIVLDLGELGKDTWQVVGLYEPVFAAAYTAETIYAPQSALFEATQKYNQGRVLYVRTRVHDASAVNAVTTRLKDLYERHNIKVSVSQTELDLRKQQAFQFSTTTSMLLGLAILIAIVGGLALMGALSISVVERTQEIGVLRAVGARSRTIRGMFVMEGVLQGLMSWLFAAPIAYALGQPFADGLGHAMFSAALDYQYNWLAVSAWLAIILVISTLASLLPARHASRISVRQNLAYA